jgi:hypothetical protein
VLALAIANPNPGNIPIKEVQAIVARTGSDKNLRGPDGTFSKTFLDIGILRFPDPEFPFIRVSSLKQPTCKT